MVATRNPPCWAHSSTEFWIRLSSRSITERDLPHARCNYSKEHGTSTTNTNALGLSIRQLSQLKLPWSPSTHKSTNNTAQTIISIELTDVVPTEVLTQTIGHFLSHLLNDPGCRHHPSSSTNRSHGNSFVYSAPTHVFTPSHLNHVIGRLLQLDTAALRSTDSSFMPLDFSRSISFVPEVDPYSFNSVTHPVFKDIHDLMPLPRQFFPSARWISMNYHNWWYIDSKLTRL